MTGSQNFRIKEQKNGYVSLKMTKSSACIEIQKVTCLLHLIYSHVILYIQITFNLQLTIQPSYLHTEYWFRTFIWNITGYKVQLNTLSGIPLPLQFLQRGTKVCACD